MPARPGAVVFGPDTRIVLEFQDDKPTFFYLFSVVNNARTPVDPGKPLVLDLPADGRSGVARVRAASPIARMQDRRLTLDRSVSAGTDARSRWPSACRSPRTLRIEQAWPAAVEGALVAAEKVGAPRHDVAAADGACARASRTGKSFVMGTAGRLAEGQPLTLEFTGLPAPPAWPR